MAVKKERKFRVHLPYECLFDLRWGFARKYSGLDDAEMSTRFYTFCSRVTDDIGYIFPTLTRPFVITPETVALSPRTGILSLITNAFRQYSSEYPDDIVSLHITVNFDVVRFIPNSLRRKITDSMMESLQGTLAKVHVNHIAESYEENTLRNLRRKYECLIVYNIREFVDYYNATNPSDYCEMGIITRPLFKDKDEPARFHNLVNSVDKRSGGNKNQVDPGDHYDIANDAFSRIGPIYLHPPEHFSALTPVN